RQAVRVGPTLFEGGGDFSLQRFELGCRKRRLAQASRREAKRAGELIARTLSGSGERRLVAVDLELRAQLVEAVLDLLPGVLARPALHHVSGRGAQGGFAQEGF